MDPKTQATTAVGLLAPLVEHVHVGQLAQPTPCTEWTVRDLLNHMIGGGHMFATALRGQALPPDSPTDLVGDDHHSAFRASIDNFSSALAATDDLAQPVTLPFGTLPAAAALQLAAGDLLVHAWDLATATDQRFEPPVEFVNAALGFFEATVNDDMRAAGLFAPAVAVRDDAPALHKLLGHAGRRA